MTKFEPEFDPSIRKEVLKAISRFSKSVGQASDWVTFALRSPSTPRWLLKHLSYGEWIKEDGEPVGRYVFALQRKRWFVDYKSMICHNCGKGYSDGSGTRWPFDPTWYKSRYHVVDYPRYCCNSCSKSAPEVPDKKISTTQARWGVDNVAQHPSVRTRMSESLVRSHGVPEVFQSDSPIRKESERRLYRDRGVKNFMQLPEVQEKTQATHARNGGNPLQRPEIFRKVRSSLHEMKSESMDGRHFEGLMGLEPKALHYLRSRFGTHRILAGSDVSLNFKYGRPRDQHTYHPDMLITSRSRVKYVVEVKSPSTLGIVGNPFNVNESILYERNRSKIKSVSNSGLLPILVLVLDRKEPRFLVYEGPLPSRRAVLKEWKLFKSSDRRIKVLKDNHV